MYICKSCERSESCDLAYPLGADGLGLREGTSQRTVYKLACKRDGCNNSVAGKASK
jgi:hypothetical protein